MKVHPYAHSYVQVYIFLFTLLLIHLFVGSSSGQKASHSLGSDTRTLSKQATQTGTQLLEVLATAV